MKIKTHSINLKKIIKIKLKAFKRAKNLNNSNWNQNLNSKRVKKLNQRKNRKKANIQITTMTATV